MKKEDIDFKTISDEPGIYLFYGSGKKPLYIGRATSLRDRVRSYFSSTLGQSRGMRLIEALEKTKRIETIVTDSILDSIVLELNYIKKYNPVYNAREKDDKSLQYLCITKEEYPRIVTVRGRELNNNEYEYILGPFPKSNLLNELIKILRKILPFRDKCKPNSGKRCFRAQLGLCPGVCDGSVSKTEYKKRIREIKLFLDSKKDKLILSLEKDMNKMVKVEKFEEAGEIKRKIFSLKNIQDVNLIKRDIVTDSQTFRIEGYDISHISGTDAVGVMVVYDKEFLKKEYRSFNVNFGNNDTASLRDILSRRLNHPEWRFPNLIVIDGGKGQLNAAKKVLTESGIKIPVVSVVKDDRHKAREILGDKKYIEKYNDEIILTNQESHRFAVSKLRYKQKKRMFK